MGGRAGRFNKVSARRRHSIARKDLRRVQRALGEDVTSKGIMLSGHAPRVFDEEYIFGEGTALQPRATTRVIAATRSKICFRKILKIIRRNVDNATYFICNYEEPLLRVF